MQAEEAAVRLTEDFYEQYDEELEGEEEDEDGQDVDLNEITFAEGSFLSNAGEPECSSPLNEEGDGYRCIIDLVIGAVASEADGELHHKVGKVKVIKNIGRTLYCNEVHLVALQLAGFPNPYSCAPLFFSWLAGE